MFNFKNGSLGFTLFELMISMAVISIVSSVVFAGKNQEEKKLFLKTTAFSLSQNLREYQEKALSAQNIACPSPSHNLCGFGFNFVEGNDFYTPFADCSLNCLSSGHFLDENDVIFSAVSLGKTKICSLAGGNLNIVFSPPDPTVYLNNVKWGSEVGIALCLKSDTAIQKNVKVNNAGKIEIQ